MCSAIRRRFIASGLHESRPHFHMPDALRGELPADTPEARRIFALRNDPHVLREVAVVAVAGRDGGTALRRVVSVSRGVSISRLATTRIFRDDTGAGAQENLC